jgi:hypothetical protein
MALFAAFVVALVFIFNGEFLRIAAKNIWLNGIIIGLTIFGIGLCFVDVFKLLPEYKWLRQFFYRGGRPELPPRLLRPVAIVLQNNSAQKSYSTGVMNNFLDSIIIRFEDQRDSVRYITNTLIFLGLLGTFWGLIHTVGGFADLVNGLNFDDENIMNTLQSGLAGPLAGMGIAFTSSLFGLAGSLIVGFLGLQVQMAQNSIFRELEENLSQRAKLFNAEDGAEIATAELTRAVQKLEKTVQKLT